MTLKMTQQQLKRETILTDINLELIPGKVYGLLGRNGAGKTSLLSLIASYRKVTNGSITWTRQESLRE